MRLIRAGLKFRVELHADAEVVLRHFHGLDEVPLMTMPAFVSVSL